ncbi:hypothetical protein SAMN05421788_101504 [Filimonas lacunae]|uniref:Uncharacterized protein n=1 Tax=Filimonas lacunae TaxID=477680 RepID=A0A173MNK0_9BACT|nr:hypothetical protein [Filimonas lacunae]BAV09057.1 hypothetical protein FLA_5104 [Filimonas lacunae]SIS66581.1 hypothetical protein SAMN05421788_101504 [Filimonas lacunae]
MQQALFIAITFTTVLLLWLATGRNKQLGVFYLAWMLVAGYLAYNGFFNNPAATPPRLLWAILPAMIATFYFYKRIPAPQLHYGLLLSVHLVRILVEGMLYLLYKQGKIPVSMTFCGWNYDVLTGISALILLLYYVRVKRCSVRLLMVWNWLGLLLLAIIVVTAILSAPSPFQQLAFEQPNVAILQFPYTLLPAVIVPAVLLSHLLMLKMGKTAR